MLNKKQFLENKKNFLKLSEIFFIILLGFFLRIYKIKQTFIFGPEQALSLWPIIRLFEEKKLTLIGVPLANYESGLFRAPFFIYLFALPLKFLKFNPLALGIIFILISLGTICLLYLSTKSLFDKKTGLIASLLYTVSFYLIKADKNVWNYTPIIFTSSLILFLLTTILKKQKKEKEQKKKLSFFLIGSLIGLGFSFHFQIIIILVSLVILIFLFKFKKKNFLSLFIGLLLLLSPLIIFDLRHDFIILNGFKKLFFTQEVITKGSLNFLERINNGFKTFSNLAFHFFNLEPKPHSLITNLLIFSIFFLFPGFFIYQRSCLKIEKIISSYFLLSCLIGLIVLIIIDRTSYPTGAFYLWFLIPVLITIWTRFLILITKENKPYKLGVTLLMLIFLIPNLFLILNQKPTNYQTKIDLVNYVLKNSKKQKSSIKFINKDVLSFDYLFYYRAPFYGLTFNNLNLIQQWQTDKADFFLLSGDYDWNKDKYNIKPFEKIVDFQSLKNS